MRESVCVCVCVYEAHLGGVDACYVGKQGSVCGLSPPISQQKRNTITNLQHDPVKGHGISGLLHRAKLKHNRANSTASSL